MPSRCHTCTCMSPRVCDSASHSVTPLIRPRMVLKSGHASAQVRLFFTQVGKLPPPVLQFQNVTFGYSHAHVLYQNVRRAHIGPCLAAHPGRACASDYGSIPQMSAQWCVILAGSAFLRRQGSWRACADAVDVKH